MTHPLAAEARRLRIEEELSNRQIRERLGVSTSTAYLWVRHLPLDADPEAERARRRAHSKVMTDARWG